MSRFIVTRTLDDGNELTIWEEYPGECFVTDTRHPDEEAVFSGYWEECLAYCYDEELATLEKRLDNLEGCEDNEVYAEEIKGIRLKMAIVEGHKERLAEKNKRS